jgi:hypothetical protein
MPRGLDALAGLAAFPNRVLVLDPDGGRIVFVPREEANSLAAQDGAFPLVARRLRHTLRVRATIAQLQAELLVDTGARYSWISPRIAEELAQNGKLQGRLVSGRADLGVRALRVEFDGPLDGGLGCDILLGLGRPVLLDLDGERVVLLPPRSLKH